MDFHFLQPEAVAMKASYINEKSQAIAPNAGREGVLAPNASY
jgi:hypothetical protein